MLHREQQTIINAAGTVVHVADLGVIRAGARIGQRGHTPRVRVARARTWVAVPRRHGERATASRTAPISTNIKGGILFISRRDMHDMIAQVSDRKFPIVRQLLFKSEVPCLGVAGLHIYREYEIGAFPREEGACMTGRKRLRERVAAWIVGVRIREQSG